MFTNVILVGPMGAGKSTIGRMLAGRLALSFVDTDHVIEERTGADIPWIFDVEGESGFRDRETAVLQDVLHVDSSVIATGGGIIERDLNRRMLADHRCVVYLTAGVEQLVNRTFRDKKRPLLQVADPKAKIIELLARRDPLYREVASYVLHTDGLSPKQACQKIADFVATV